MAELEKIRALSHACKRCASCRDWSWFDPALPGFLEGYTKKGYTICPAFKHSSGFESSYARGKLRLALGLIEDRFEADGEVAQRIFECTACGNCSEHCPATRQGKLDPLEAIVLTRSFMVERGFPVPAGLRPFVGQVSKRAPISERWIPREERGEASATLGYFPGCASPSVVSRLFPSIARSFLGILRLAAVPHQTIDEGWCCGYLQYLAGDLPAATAFLRGNLEVLQRRGIRTLVTTCAGCYHMFRVIYPRLSTEWRDQDVEVLHSAELLTCLLRETKLQVRGSPSKRALRVAFHDPCDLGRKSGVFEPPRDAIRRLPNVELVEMEQNRENGFCCGAGGGLRVVNPEMSLDIASDRVSQAEQVHADMLVSACPACLWNLGQAARKRGSSIVVMDLCELAAAAAAGRNPLAGASSIGSGAAVKE
jgi:Fe-S oxidoreductase